MHAPQCCIAATKQPPAFPSWNSLHRATAPAIISSSLSLATSRPAHIAGVIAPTYQAVLGD